MWKRFEGAQEEADEMSIKLIKKKQVYFEMLVKSINNVWNDFKNLCQRQVCCVCVSGNDVNVCKIGKCIGQRIK